jgi:hypothetical protein
MNKVLGYIADATAIGDFVMNTIELEHLRKKQKENLNLTIGIHLALSVLAVGVSLYQTNNIKETIRKEVRQ